MNMEMMISRIKMGVANIDDACTVCWDGSGYDSTQHTLCFNNVDDVFYDTKSETIFSQMKKEEKKISAKLKKNLKQQAKSTRSKVILRAWCPKPITIGEMTLEGTTFSGASNKTTFGNT